MLLVLNLPLVGLWVKLLAIPKPQLYAGILVFATMGVYWHAPVAVRRLPALRDRARGLPHAPLRFPGGAR
jgi:hypothetical protein